jgi:hypothetical protein
MLSLNGGVKKSYGSASSLATLETLSGAVVAQLSMLLCQGRVSKCATGAWESARPIAGEIEPVHPDCSPP